MMKLLYLCQLDSEMINRKEDVHLIHMLQYLFLGIYLPFVAWSQMSGKNQPGM